MKRRFATRLPGLNVAGRSAAAPISLIAQPLVLVERPKEGPVLTPRRAKIWELSRYLHCSVIGTCLSTNELRHILSKAGYLTDGASDHDLHGKGVTVAGQQDVAGKLLHKALDKCHRQALNQFAKAKSDVELAALWREAVTRGEIPGAYWAALTHPEASDKLVGQMFGEVHMLSHLVGAANRADILRLNALEAENAALREKLRRQEAHLREGISTRDATIRDLNELLTRRISELEPGAGAIPSSSAEAALTALVADLERRLGAESRRRSTMEARLERLADEARRDREALSAVEARERVLRSELDALEASVLGSADDESQPDERAAASPRLDGLSILYVGGWPHQHTHLRTLTQRMGLDLLFHDGGIEDRHGLLAGMVSRADVVMFPVDCVSHEAVSAVKRLCRHAGKPFVPLRSGGISSFLVALERMEPHGASAVATPA